MAFIPPQRPAFTPRPQGTGTFQKPQGTFTRPAGKQGSSGGAQVKTFDRRPQMVYTNEQIKAPTIIIVDEQGVNLGTFPRLKALAMAQDAGLDLIQIRYDQEKMVSTVKMADYGKYMYLKGKDEKEKRKTQKPTSLKEVKLNYAIGMNDLQLKIKKAREMLGDSYNVKFFIKLKGREKIFAEKAVEKLNFVRTELADVGKSQYDKPKEEMSGYSIILFSK